MKWEYMVKNDCCGADARLLKEYLNKYGNDGWELVSIERVEHSSSLVTSSNIKTFIFKRAIKE
jgi:hypothetical protein